MLLRIKSKIRRHLNNKLVMHRPASYPFLSGDSYRSIANFVFDQFLDFNPTEVKRGDTVFVRNNLLEEYFLAVHPQITEPYVLISGNEDSSVSEKFMGCIDGKILHWYAQNLNFVHPQTTLLPIGLQNFQTKYPDNFVQVFKLGRPTDFSLKKPRVMYGFSVDPHNPDRVNLHSMLPGVKVADKVELSRLDYYESLTKYQYVIAPHGAGLDCHRNWESLYLRTIPIMRRDTFSLLFALSGFPVLIIDSWDDLLNLDEEGLDDYYQKNVGLFNNPKLLLPYWYDAFNNHK